MVQVFASAIRTNLASRKSLYRFVRTFENSISATDEHRSTRINAFAFNPCEFVSILADKFHGSVTLAAQFRRAARVSRGKAIPGLSERVPQSQLQNPGIARSRDLPEQRAAARSCRVVQVHTIEDIEAFSAEFEFVPFPQGIRNALNRDASNVASPGPRIVFRPRVPNVPGALSRNAALLNQAAIFSPRLLSEGRFGSPIISTLSCPIPL